jgi:uncharacterized protein
MNQQLNKLMQGIIEFEWDEANVDKIWRKHQVRAKEAEQVFINPPFLFFYDSKHSIEENRYAIYGSTNTNRRLCIIFTLRKKNKIRIISARGFHSKELQSYLKRKVV